MVKRGGEWVAVCHEVAKTGYKAKNAYGAKSIFYGETTNSYFQNGVKHVGSGSGSQKKLMPYYPNASRNRPKETMENITGTRFNTCQSKKSVETYRGSSVVTLRDGDPESSRTWKTTNQIFSECALVSDTIGLEPGNQLPGRQGHAQEAGAVPDGEGDLGPRRPRKPASVPCLLKADEEKEERKN